MSHMKSAGHAVSREPPRSDSKHEHGSDAHRLPLVPIAVWQGDNRHVIPSMASLRWFLRRHRERLVEAGALYEIAGRFFFDPSRANPEILAIARDLAADSPQIAPIESLGDRRTSNP